VRAQLRHHAVACALLKDLGMECPSMNHTPRRSTVAALLVPLAAGIGAGPSGCAPVVGVDDTLAAPALVADGRSRAEVALVVIDAGASIPLTPGESVGLFVQYAPGGHWNLSTTCDTRLSGQSCAFDVVISPAPGASLSGVEGQGLSRDGRLVLGSDGTVRLVTATSFGTDGITFDSDPGALVEIDALLDGAEQPRLVHVVSEGVVVEGVPTNPVELSPSAP
jgi:hypothetical protein